jgi:Outer membrane protein beta-barrel domain
MRRVLAVLTLGVAIGVGLPTTAAAGGLDLRIGAFKPRADSTLFDDNSELYTVDKDDWWGVYGGAEYSFKVARTVELGFHVDGYGRTVDTVYRDFTRPDGREIAQSLKLEMVPIGMTVRFVPRPGRGEITPYVGVGADLVYWNYEEFGDFIDFNDPERHIIGDHFDADGTAPGFHVAVGLRVPVSYDFSIVGEVRYLWMDDDMGDDFSSYRGPHQLDLQGASATLGVNIRF